MAEALQHLHARGIAHLDVKPDNIYTTRDGAYKLGDFGLACPRGGVTHTLSPEEGDSRCAGWHHMPGPLCWDCCTYIAKSSSGSLFSLHVLSWQMHKQESTFTQDRMHAAISV